VNLQACARLVEAGDPDRFAAAMAAPLAARQALFALYAFNVEVTRAPWLTQEPMIAEMRLQWWRDALEEIAAGGPVRKHEVTQALAQVIDREGAQDLDRLVAARRWDVYKDAFEDGAHFREYIEATSGALMWQAARALGAPDALREAVQSLGYTAGLARYLSAVAALEALGRLPLVDGREAAVATLAQDGLAELERLASRAPELPAAVRPALFEGWQAAPLLRQISRQPWRVAQGAVGLSPFRKKWRLLRWGLGAHPLRA
jgi:phytoene synthase